MDRYELRTRERLALEEKLKNIRINDCTRALLGIVKDKQDDTIFYDYEPKAEIGRNIYFELSAKFKKGVGFILSDDSEDVGLLTQAQGACSLDNLIGGFKAMEAMPSADALELKENYEWTIRSIFSLIQEADGEFIFKASPYNAEVFSSKYAYIDSMTWVISAFLGAISLNGCEYTTLDAGSRPVCISFTDEEIALMLRVIAFSIRYLTHSYIANPDTSRQKLSYGWNFTANCSEPSLYFTYGVSECYLDIYSTFQQIVDKHNIEIKLENIRNDPQHNLTDPDGAWLYLSGFDRIALEGINEELDEYKKLKAYFDIVNGNDDAYYTLERQVKESAQNAWELVKDGIDNSFYNYNLSGVIDRQAIESSSSTDALFNNIFVINNVISGGLDEDLRDRLANAEDEDEMNRLQSEYDDLFETLQAALQMVIRYNKALKSKQKDYIVNDFIISCSESFTGDLSKKAQELRKRRIKAFTLPPLLVKTNNLISEFLTQYPQVDMIKYLDDLLMKNRSTIEMTDANGATDSYYIWIWENGEYLVTSNYYYFTSLSSFYDYIDKFETRFSTIDRQNANYKEQLLSDYLSELRSSGEIFKLNSESAELRRNNGELLEKIAELEAKESKVEIALRDFMEHEIKPNLLGWVTADLRGVVSKMTANIESGRDTLSGDCSEETAFLDSLQSALIMSLYPQFINLLRYNEGSAKELVKKFQESFGKEAGQKIRDVLESVDN